MKKINPKMVDGEPVCSGKRCGFYDHYTYKTHFCTFNNYQINRRDPCVPGLRDQRDGIEAENEKLKARLREALTFTCIHVTDSQICPHCGNERVHGDECWERIAQKLGWKVEWIAEEDGDKEFSISID